MRIFIAGASGAIGRFLVPMLIREGHEVVGLTRAADKAQQIEQMGAKAVVGDVYDQARLAELVKQATPKVVIHQLTTFGVKDRDPLTEAVASLERQTVEAAGMTGLVLRYGWFYGPGTNYDPEGQIPQAIRKGRMPIVGAGAGTYSFINLPDAAAATLKAFKHGASNAKAKRELGWVPRHPSWRAGFEALYARP